MKWQVSVGVGRIWDAAWIHCIYQTVVAARCRPFTNHHFIVSYRSQWFLDSWPFIFGGWRRHTHTHSTAGHWCGGLMIKQALHVGVSKGQNPKHESNSLKVCFKLGKPALSCRQIQTKWDGHRWIRSVNTSNVVKNWSKGLQSCDLGEQNTCVAI